MNYKWNYQPPTQEQREAARALAKDIGISPILCRLLQERGIRTAEEAKSFFRPQLTELHDPFLMRDMEKAVERLNLALGRKERILVYGDYDVDGTTAVALVYKFLQQFEHRLLHPRPLQRRVWSIDEGGGLRRQHRRTTGHRARLRHQGGRGNRLCTGKRH